MHLHIVAPSMAQQSLRLAGLKNLEPLDSTHLATMDPKVRIRRELEGPPRTNEADESISETAPIRSQEQS
jgi:hypothetical protein